MGTSQRLDLNRTIWCDPSLNHPRLPARGGALHIRRSISVPWQLHKSLPVHSIRLD
jgi:hypothetical protein